MKSNDFNLSDNNPFRIDFNNTLTGSKTRVTQMDVPGGAVRKTLTYTEEYTPSGKWIKLYQNEVLNGLSANASKLFIYLATQMEYNAERVYLTQAGSGMGNRSYPKAIRELIEKRIIEKEKRGWYWVNVTILVMGKINLDSTKLVPSGL